MHLQFKASQEAAATLKSVGAKAVEQNQECWNMKHIADQEALPTNRLGVTVPDMKPLYF